VLVQGGKPYPVFAKPEPPRRWSYFRKAENPRSYQFEVGSKAAPGLADGKAELVVEAVSNDLWAKRTRLVQPLEVNTKPPSVQVDDTQIVITQGGAGAVAFFVSGYWTEAGVRIGSYQFRSFPNPGSKDPMRRISIFAIPHDLPAGEKPVVFARNPAGVEVTAPIKHDLDRKKFRTREMDLPESFVGKVLTELDRGGSGDPVERFRRVNNELRKANNQTLHALRLKTEERPLWNGPFLQLANSAVQAQFCDYRKYKYEGKLIDEQVHLGFDLASTKHADVLAANDGKVIYAAPLGIYGNAIVVDHGLAVQSLYAHLSEIKVKVGDTVKRSQLIGQSGATGLAGGDHLHFSIQVDGVSVNPLEWWDPAWIEKRLTSRFR
ncbi:MAG: M23 family metallopeptidase, partial [Bryobacterales bacterium]|nr:M23 family metallopeptidase [Bryobacterales bacterium]